MTDNQFDAVMFTVLVLLLIWAARRKHGKSGA